MNQFFQDLRYAFRMLRKSAGLTAVIVLSLAIGIGANTAIFSVVDALLLKPLPYPQPDRLVALWLRAPGIGITQDWPSPGQYSDILAQSRSFEEISLSRGSTPTVLGRDQPERVDALVTSSNLFHLLGAQPAIGRLLLPEDDRRGQADIAVLSDAVWRRLFNSDPHIVGRAINLSGRSVTVVGVLRPGFLLNHEVMETVASTDRTDIFMPLPFVPNSSARRGDENFNLLARLKPGVTVPQAQADIDVIASRIRQQDKRDRTFTIGVIGLLDQVVGNVRRALLVLLGSVALVLLIACANVANLLLTRATRRQKEVAIRTALGAARTRLIRQLLTESTLLGLMGGAGGLLITAGGLYVLRILNPSNIPRLETIGIDGGVLAFTFCVSLLTGVIFGLAPAIRAGRVDLNTTLKAGGRSSQGEGGLSAARPRLRNLLVVSELALSLMLLVGAGLLVRSFARLQDVPPGFRTKSILSMRVAGSGPKFRDPAATVHFFQGATDRILHLPGVQAVGSVSALPLSSAVSWGGIQVEGFTPQPGQELQADIRTASTGYFSTLEIPLRKGRFFNEHDTRDMPLVVIIDDKLAQRFFGGVDPIGKHVSFDPKRPMTVVGVVGSVKQYGLDSDTKIVVYAPDLQFPSGSMYTVVRTSGNPASLAGAVVREFRAVDRDVPVYEIRTMEDRLRDSLARQRFAMIMLSSFALFALILAAVGVYGVISYLVTQGTHDIGVRIALGAQQQSIVRLVVRQGMQLAGVGIVLGIAGALLLTRLMASLLFGVSATDVLTFSVVPVMLAAIALAACSVPAWRATRVDPMVALRDE